MADAPPVAEYLDDAPEERIVPDPLLTLSEVVNTFSAISIFLEQHRPEGDAVLETARERLRAAAQVHAEEHPDQMAAVTAEVAMQERLNSRPHG